LIQCRVLSHLAGGTFVRGFGALLADVAPDAALTGFTFVFD
jgi:hypothetical protein